MQALQQAETFQEAPAVSGLVTQGGTGAALFCSSFLEPVPPPVPCGFPVGGNQQGEGEPCAPQLAWLFSFYI